MSFFLKKKIKKIFFPRFLKFSRFPIIMVDTRPCEYVTQEKNFFFSWVPELVS